MNLFNNRIREYSGVGSIETSTYLDKRSSNLPKSIRSSSVIYSPEPYTYNKTIATIESFRKLEDNWDSYGGIKPSDITIKKSIDFVEKLSKNNIAVYFTAPTTNGEILIELKNGNKTIEFFFLNKNVEYAKFDHEECVKEEELENSLYPSNLLEWLIK